jgi:eukaryotic-like serine/threonine-protein kinase
LLYVSTIQKGRDHYIEREDSLWAVQKDRIATLAWSPDGKRIASAHDDKTVQVWDAIGGNHLYIYYGHFDFVYAVAWSPDGKRIASAGEDRTAQVWDAVDGGHPYTYSGHTNSVRSVAWSPDSRHIASGSWDKTVQVWQPVPAERLAVSGAEWLLG